MRREQHHAAGVVVFREGAEREYLLLRSALTRRPIWEFPKGGVEEGETEREAAVRELAEETGLVGGDVALREGFSEEERYIFTQGKGERRRLVAKRVAYFLAEWCRGEIHISRESLDYRWASYEDARNLVRFSEKRRVLEAAQHFLDGKANGRPDHASAAAR